MQNHEAHSFTFEAYFAPPPHTLTHTSARVENAFHNEVASTEMATMATPLGGGFPNNSQGMEDVGLYAHLRDGAPMALVVCLGSFRGGDSWVDSGGLLNPSLRDKKRHTRVCRFL